MPIRRRHMLAVSAAGLVLVFMSCDRNRSSPLPTPGEPPPTPAPFVVRLELVGPSEIAPGETVQLIANAIKSDGSVEDVTSQSLFSPTTSPVLELTVRGLATGKTSGQVNINARFGSRNAGKTIIVLPTGTFRLTGNIRETGFGIDGVTVSVTSGTGAGLTTTSGFTGSYALFGVKGLIRIEARKNGYLNLVQQLDVTEHRTHDVEIVAERARADFRGTYTLTIVAAGFCASLAAEARRREYTANVAQDGPRLTVTLEDANFIVTNGRGRGFTGFLAVSNDIRFDLGNAFYYYYYYGGSFDIAERIGNITVLISGTANTLATPGRIAGQLEGGIATSSKAAAPFAPFNTQCHGSHGFEMVRR